MDNEGKLSVKGELGIRVIRARPTLRSRIADALWSIRYRLWERRR